MFHVAYTKSRFSSQKFVYYTHLGTINVTSLSFRDYRCIKQALETIYVIYSFKNNLSIRCQNGGHASRIICQNEFGSKQVGLTCIDPHTLFVQLL